LRGLDQQELNRVFQASVRRVQEVSEGKALEATSDDKQVLSIKVLRIFIRPGWGMYLSIRRYRASQPRICTLDWSMFLHLQQKFGFHGSTALKYPAVKLEKLTRVNFLTYVRYLLPYPFITLQDSCTD
jgi:hypothetical protein